MHYIEPSQDIRALCEKFAVLMKKLDSAEKDKVDLNDQLNDCHQSIKQLDSQHTREVYGKDVEITALKEEIIFLKNNIRCRDVFNSVDETQRLREEIDSLRKQFLITKNICTETTSLLEKAVESERQSKAALESLQKSHSDCLESLEAASVQATRGKQECLKLKTSVKNIEAEKIDNQNQVTRLRDELRVTIKKLSSTKQQLEEESVNRKNAETKSAKLEERLTVVRGEVNRLRKQMDSVVESEKEWKIEKEVLQKNSESLSKGLTEVETLKQEIQAERAGKMRISIELKESISKNETLVATVDELKARLIASQQKLRSMQDRRDDEFQKLHLQQQQQQLFQMRLQNNKNNLSQSDPTTTMLMESLNPSENNSSFMTLSAQGQRAMGEALKALSPNRNYWPNNENYQLEQHQQQLQPNLVSMFDERESSEGLFTSRRDSMNNASKNSIVISKASTSTSVKQQNNTPQMKNNTGHQILHTARCFTASDSYSAQSSSRENNQIDNKNPGLSNFKHLDGDNVVNDFASTLLPLTSPSRTNDLGTVWKFIEQQEEQYSILNNEKKTHNQISKQPQKQQEQFKTLYKHKNVQNLAATTESEFATLKSSFDNNTDRLIFDDDHGKVLKNARVISSPTSSRGHESNKSFGTNLKQNTSNKINGETKLLEDEASHFFMQSKNGKQKNVMNAKPEEYSPSNIAALLNTRVLSINKDATPPLLMSCDLTQKISRLKHLLNPGDEDNSSERFSEQNFGQSNLQHQSDKRRNLIQNGMASPAKRLEDKQQINFNGVVREWTKSPSSSRAGRLYGNLSPPQSPGSVFNSRLYFNGIGREETLESETSRLRQKLTELNLSTQRKKEVNL